MQTLKRGHNITQDEIMICLLGEKEKRNMKWVDKKWTGTGHLRNL